MKLTLNSEGLRVQVPILNTETHRQELVTGVISSTHWKPGSPHLHAVVCIASNHTWSGPETCVFPVGKQGERMWDMQRHLMASRRAVRLREEVSEKRRYIRACDKTAKQRWERATKGLSPAAIRRLLKAVIA